MAFAYATEPVYRSYINEDSDADALNNVQALLAASEWVDGKLRRSFNKTEELEARVFYVNRHPTGSGSHILRVDDIASRDGVEVSVGGQVVDPSAYELSPLNADKGRTPWPFEEIALKAGHWPLGEPITVTAYWGWPDVPHLIQVLTMEWAAVWQGKSIRTTQRVQEFDQVERTSVQHQSQMKQVRELFTKARRPVAGVLVR